MMKRVILMIVAAGLVPLVESAVTIETVPVGDPGNAPDPYNTN